MKHKRLILGVLLANLIVPLMLYSNQEFNPTQKTSTIEPTKVQTTSCLNGYNVAFVNTGSNPGEIKEQLELWEFTVHLIDLPDITVSSLSGYCAVWIPLHSCNDGVDAAGKADEILKGVTVTARICSAATGIHLSLLVWLDLR